MDAGQLWETTMDPKRRVLLKTVTMDWLPDGAYPRRPDRTFSMLMGNEVEPGKISSWNMRSIISMLDGIAGPCTRARRPAKNKKGDPFVNRDDLQLFMTMFEEQNLLRAAELLYSLPLHRGRPPAVHGGRVGLRAV